MRKDFTDITVIMDRSGSMYGMERDVEGGFEGFIEDQKKIKGDARVTLVQFDDQYEEVYNSINLAFIPKMKLEPRGMTALLDAIARAVKSTGERLSSMKEEDRPDKVIVIIMTDGYENSSREFTREKVMDMIKHQREVYNWQFVFLGAGQDAIASGVGMGVLAGCSLTYNHTHQGYTRAYNVLSHSVASFRSGASDSLGFSEQDRKDVTEG